MPARPDPEPRDLRASDADRENVVNLLRDAASDGRLTLEEHTERVEKAYAARTLGDLKDLTRDLVRPGTPAGAPGATADGLPDVERRPLTAFFNTDRRAGRWVVPARQQVTAFFGTAQLDFREALLQQRHVVVQVNVVLGSVELLVPEGVEVRFAGGAAILGSKENRVRTAPDPHAPVIEIQSFCLLGSITAKNPKRPSRWMRNPRRGFRL